MVTAVIGVGLIGGSLAIELRTKGVSDHIIGVDSNGQHAVEALALGIVDDMMDLESAVMKADLVILTTPVKAAVILLPQILDKIRPDTVVMDMGSTKDEICKAVKHHPNRNQYVASHPIAGTENSGPKAALKNLFSHKIGILCDISQSNDKAVALAKSIYQALDMNLVYMDSDSHDMHVAYVSHISHISSFVLAITVLDIEKNTSTIFDLAGSGFASTVRLAKSSPAMWGPIFEQNAKYISQALGSYIEKLSEFKAHIDNNNGQAVQQLMEKANEIRKILKD